jgi:hypothetical protein
MEHPRIAPIREFFMKLGKNVFLAIAAVGGADGVVSKADVEALLRAAAECGVDGADLTEVERVASLPKGRFDVVKNLAMTPEERLFAYAIATWLVRSDGVVMPEEKMALMKLGDVLRLADGDRTRASSASFQVEQLAPGDRPQKFEIFALADRMKSALSASLPPPEGAPPAGAAGAGA